MTGPAKKRFKKIYIEIINQCNLSCRFCPATKREAGMMTPKQFRQVIEKIRPYTDYIYLHVKGEPLLHPQLKQLLEIAAQFGLQVNLTTNGTLLKTTEPVLFAMPVRQINISLHSFEANTVQSGSLPSGLDYDGYITQAIEFARAYAKVGSIVCFRLWNQASDDDNSSLLNRLIEAFGDTGSSSPSDFRTKDMPLAPKIFLSFDRQFQWPDLLAPDFGSFGTCQGLKTHLGILCDGTVIPCCLDGNGIIALGNIFTENMETILNTPRSRSILEGFRTKNITEPLCRRCGYRTRF